MPRYIDLDEAIKHLRKVCIVKYPISYSNGISTAINEISRIPTADVVPKSEVQRIFEELYNSVASKIPMLFQPIFKDDMDFDGGFYNGKRNALLEVLVIIDELKKKYVTDTNVGGITAAEAIAKLSVDNYEMSRALKTAVKLIEGWQDTFSKLSDAKIIEGLQPIEAITSVHMLTLERYKDTNIPTKEDHFREVTKMMDRCVSSGDICVVCGEHVHEGRQICSMCETGQEFLRKRKE